MKKLILYLACFCNTGLMLAMDGHTRPETVVGGPRPRAQTWIPAHERERLELLRRAPQDEAQIRRASEPAREPVCDDVFGGGEIRPATPPCTTRSAP